MKNLVREKVRKIRDSLSLEYRQLAEEKINLRLLNFIKTEKFKVVAGYYPIKSEVSILKTLGSLVDSKVCLPRIEENGLVFRKWTIGSPLELNKHCFEPPKEAVICPPDVIIVPCLAYDMTGQRIGYGSGYYDRALSHFSNIPKILVAFSKQEVQSIPYDSYDVKVDVIINEVAITNILK